MNNAYSTSTSRCGVRHVVDSDCRSSMPELSLAIATKRDLVRTTRTLVRAFRDDPFYRWMLPDRRKAAALFRIELRHALWRDTVRTANGGHGLIWWQRPRGLFGALLDVSLLVRLSRLLGSRTQLVMQGFRMLAAKVPQVEHRTAIILGTDPDHQRKGIATALLGAFLDECDSDRVPAYLVASNERVIPFYERHGFDALDSVDLPHGPTQWPMLRKNR
jgi:GNAT superfamily N-acetyltransferase